MDVVVNVPGINRRKPVLELGPSEFSEVLDVNIQGWRTENPERYRYLRG